MDPTQKMVVTKVISQPTGTVTHPQLFEGLKYESQVENNGKDRSRGALPNSQH